ncbi:hypothetical protein OQA88_2179 [Cercophora sp. LCS_1]
MTDNNPTEQPKVDALQQPGDAVQMSEMNTQTERDATERGLSIPVPAKDTDPSERSPKGKAKEELPVPGEKREGDSLSIEPSDPQPAVDLEPIVCTITLLLPTGARHPYKIDEKYLTKRSVEVPDSTEDGRKDPFSISVYKLKELILREWREEWEGKPASPSSIRLIFFGKLLDDKEQLKKYQFSVESPNIVHMSVRPPDMMEEDEAAKVWRLYSGCCSMFVEHCYEVYDIP